MAGTDAPIRVLIVEDSDDDALLISRELRQGGYVPEMRRVDSATAMRAALNEQTWDLIIADHNMPSFDSKDALALAKQCNINIPFILVSGSIGEEIAVDAMKSGAHDYVMKGNLTRLIPAIERELREAEIRRAHQKAEATIPRSCSNSGLHYFGSAKFLCLAGNAMARKLVHLNKGGEPTIHAEAAEILGSK